jgi:hypothetical protein
MLCAFSLPLPFRFPNKSKIINAIECQNLKFEFFAIKATTDILEDVKDMLNAFF